MTDRKKAIRGLEHCVECECNSDCPYYGSCGEAGAPPVLYDALALLKEQEAKVLEYSEIEKHPLVWLEDNDKEDVIPALFLQYNGWTAEFSRQAPDKYVDTIVRSAKVVSDERTYGITWRAWTSRPTEEQRREVPWNE